MSEFKHLKNTPYKAIVEVLLALKETTTEAQNIHLNSNSCYTLTTEVDSRIEIICNNPQLESLIKSRIIDLIIPNWHQKYNQLYNYYKKHGHTQVPIDYHDQDFARWVLFQKGKKNHHSRDKVQLLDNIGFEWSVPLNKRWRAKYEELLLYKKTHGSVKINTNIEKPLAAWVQYNKKSYKNGTLNEAQIKLLEKVGVDLKSPLKDVQGLWGKYYEELCNYNAKFKTTVVRQIGEYSKLGLWCNSQRVDARRNKLSTKKMELLRLINFNFDPLESKKAQWFQTCKEYKALKEGQRRSVEMVRWLNLQRRAIKRNKLTRNQLEMLEDAGFKLEGRHAK